MAAYPEEDAYERYGLERERKRRLIAAGGVLSAAILLARFAL